MLQWQNCTCACRPRRRVPVSSRSRRMAPCRRCRRRSCRPPRRSREASWRRSGPNWVMVMSLNTGWHVFFGNTFLDIEWRQELRSPNLWPHLKVLCFETGIQIEWLIMISDYLPLTSWELRNLLSAKCSPKLHLSPCRIMPLRPLGNVRPYPGDAPSPCSTSEVVLGSRVMGIFWAGLLLLLPSTELLSSEHSETLRWRRVSVERSEFDDDIAVKEGKICGDMEG